MESSLDNEKFVMKPSCVHFVLDFVSVSSLPEVIQLF